MQSGIVMLHIMTNNSISTGLILLAPTVHIHSQIEVSFKLLFIKPLGIMNWSSNVQVRMGKSQATTL